MNFTLPRLLPARPLRNRSFLLLWLGGIVSMTGDWALRIALPIYVVRLTGSAASVSGVVLAGLLASLVVGSLIELRLTSLHDRGSLSAADAESLPRS